MNVVGNKILQFLEFFCVEMCCHIELRLSIFHFEIYNEIKKKIKEMRRVHFLEHVLK